jgi:hypothetical protein
MKKVRHCREVRVDENEQLFSVTGGTFCSE